MIEIIIQYIASPVIVGLCTYLTVIAKDTKKTTKANGRGTMLLLRQQIIRAHHKHVVKGEPMTAFDFEDLTEVHQTYKDLDGNGLTDKMWEELTELPIVKH